MGLKEKGAADLLTSCEKYHVQKQRQEDTEKAGKVAGEESEGKGELQGGYYPGRKRREGQG